MAAPPDPLTQRLADGGPVYTETDTGRLLVEPWNAASALLFLAIALAWAVRLWGAYRRYPFLTGCLPILAVGGVGGTLYHAFRVSPVFLAMDFVPIFVLVVAATVYVWVRVSPRCWHVVAVVGTMVLLQRLAWFLPTQYAISVSYASLALLLLVPTGVVLVQTRFRDGGWVVLALLCFGAALCFRIADAWHWLAPVGTHWLWHVLGAAATAALIEYLYRLRRGRIVLTR
jgi:hemolysin III